MNQYSRLVHQTCFVVRRFISQPKIQLPLIITTNMDDHIQFVSKCRTDSEVKQAHKNGQVLSLKHITSKTQTLYRLQYINRQEKCQVLLPCIFYIHIISQEVQRKFKTARKPSLFQARFKAFSIKYLDACLERSILRSHNLTSRGSSFVLVIARLINHDTTQ